MSQEIENNFEERKKDWDLTGLLDDVIRRYIYQLTNDELNEINLEKASGMPDEEIKNGRVRLLLSSVRFTLWSVHWVICRKEQIHYFLKCNVLSRNPRSR